jgi:hypothetical protein
MGIPYAGSNPFQIALGRRSWQATGRVAESFPLPIAPCHIWIIAYGLAGDFCFKLCFSVDVQYCSLELCAEQNQMLSLVCAPHAACRSPAHEKRKERAMQLDACPGLVPSQIS